MDTDTDTDTTEPSAAEVQRVASLYLHGEKENCTTLDGCPDHTAAVMAYLSKCARTGDDFRVTLAPLSGCKYYGTIVTVRVENESRVRLARWKVWEHAGDAYHSRPSDRECDRIGVPHGSSTWDAELSDRHFESQFCYDVCYELATLLRAWLQRLVQLPRETGC